MMKKGLCAVLSAGMIFSMLSGCGTDAAPKTGKENISQEEGASAAEKDTMQAEDKEKKSGERSEEFVSLGTSSSGGTFNTLGVALCQLWNDELASTTFSAEVTAGSSENCLRIGRGELQMAFAAASSVYEAYNGTGQFEGNKVDGISAVACLYPAVIQIPVLKSSGIKNIHDIKGKKINIGEAGSGSESTILNILDSLGISTKDFSVQQMSHANAATALTDEKIDGYMVSGSAGQSHQMTAMSSGKCSLISLTEDEVNTLISDMPYYYEYTMEAGVYPNQTEDVTTITTGTLLICNENLSEDLVYQLTKSLFENLDVLEQSQAIASEISLENALNVAGVSLHPGAERYYREAGILK